MISFSTLFLSLFITLTLIPLLMREGKRYGLDVPNGRSIHTHPIPRTGGIAMAIGTIIPIIIWNFSDGVIKSIIIGALIVVIFGVIDDLKSIGCKVKFAAQFSAALIVVISGGIRIQSLGNLLPVDFILSDWVSIPLTVLFIVGITNAINLADGLDGLAAGISLQSFSLLGYLAYIQGDRTIFIVSMAIIGSIFGFLRYNTWPAKIFMGDTGSQLLGFIAGTISVRLTQGNTPLSPLLPLIILGFPILDTLTVMFERIAKGGCPFMADKNHFHHKLMRLAFSHTESVLIIYTLQAFLISAAYFLRFHSEWFLLVFYMIFSGFILLGFYISETTGWKFKHVELVDRLIKGRLRRLRDNNILHKNFFWAIYIGIPFLLLVSCLILPKVSPYFSLLSIILAAIILLLMCFKTEWLNTVIRPVLYLFIPFIIYYSHRDVVEGIIKVLFYIYNLSFGVLALLVLFDLKFNIKDKDEDRFKSTPMDFLVLFIALVVPNLPDLWIKSYNMGLVAVKIIILFYSYEVLIGELRGKLKYVSISTLAMMAIIGIKGFL